MGVAQQDQMTKSLSLSKRKLGSFMGMHGNLLFIQYNLADVSKNNL